MDNPEISLEKILIIDDIQVHRFLIVSGLTKIRKCEILQASGIQEAKDILAKNKVDAIVCDWNMPEGDGGMMVEWIREQKGISDTPFVMISGNNHIEDIIRAFMEYDLDSYVVKPFLPAGLNDKISGAIRSRKKKTDLRTLIHG
ncbi:MAG TPA: response regulator [Ignavibacteriaceae bacterium]